MNDRRDIFSSRYKMLVGFILLLMALLGLRLFVVTILQHDKWTAKAQDQSTKSVYTSAPRGNIYDRNGKIIAENRQMFSLTFSVADRTTEEINASAQKAVALLEKNGDAYTDDFPIKIRKDGSMYYTYDQSIEKWLKNEGLKAGLSADQAFAALRARYSIPASATRYQAKTLLTDTYNVSVPITVKTMTYEYDAQKKNFLSKWGVFSDKEIASGISASQAFRKLRKNYKIPASMSDAQAEKILFVRNKLASNGFQQYSAVTLATDVGKKTIAQVEEGAIDGLKISSQYRRCYPNGAVASHIIGYMGNISESDSKHYVEDLGYASTDLIGQAGVEAALEKSLHGTAGVETIQVNSSGQKVRTISKTNPKQGEDAKLTIDLRLQKDAEKALAQGIAKAGGKCRSGAVVAMDVKTGQVLALASYPDYDPNIFTAGITEKAWKSVQAKNTRDAIAPAPLYNNATMASVAPGSTFKPITAVTALELGLDPNRYITDRQFIQVGGHKWGTSLYNEGGGSFGNENLEIGMGHSSNYYFDCIGTGKDWGTGASLGYTIKISDLMNTASEFGLGHKTGIEIGETVNPLPSKKRKVAGFTQSCWAYLYNNAHKFFPASVVDHYDDLKEQCDTISSWVSEDPSYDTILKNLGKTKVKASYRAEVAAAVKYDYCAQAKWTVADQLNLSIGQGDNTYTPIQLVTYLSALGNKGKYHQATLVLTKGKEASSARTIKLKSTTIPSVIKGMKRVAKAGTLASFFGDYKYPVAGKTGTAENQGTPQPASEEKYVKEHLSAFNAAAGTSVTWDQVDKMITKLMRTSPVEYPSREDTVDRALRKCSKYKITSSMIDKYKGSYDYYAWTMTMAPADNPRVAVVTLLIQGGLSSNAAPVNKAVLNSYFKYYGKSSKKSAKKTK